jgi:hypothetical protein
MLDLIPLLLGLGLLIACAAWRPARRAWFWWLLLVAGLFTFAAGIAKWQLDATLYGADLYAIWAGRALFALGIIITIRLYLARRERRQSRTPRWTVARSFTAVVLLCALFAAAWITGSIPWVRRDGPWAAMPTTLLIAGINVLPDAAERELLARHRHRNTLDALTLQRPYPYVWQSAWTRSRFRSRIGDSPTVAGLDAAEHLLETLGDPSVAMQLYDLAFRGLASDDLATQQRAALMMPQPFDRAANNWWRERQAALGQMPPSYPDQLIALLDSTDSTVRTGAIRAIRLLEPEAARAAAPRLLELLRQEPNWHGTYDICRTIEALKIDLSSVVDEIVIEISSEDRERRCAGYARLEVLCRCEPNSLLQSTILARVNDGDDEEAVLAARAMVSHARSDQLMQAIASAAHRRPASRAPLLRLLDDAHLALIDPALLGPALQADNSYFAQRLCQVLQLHLSTVKYDARYSTAFAILTETAATHPDAAIRAAATNALAPFQTPQESE